MASNRPDSFDTYAIHWPSADRRPPHSVDGPATIVVSRRSDNPNKRTSPWVSGENRMKVRRPSGRHDTGHCDRGPLSTGSVSPGASTFSRRTLRGPAAVDENINSRPSGDHANAKPLLPSAVSGVNPWRASSYNHTLLSSPFLIASATRRPSGETVGY